MRSNFLSVVRFRQLRCPPRRIFFDLAGQLLFLLLITESYQLGRLYIHVRVWFSQYLVSLDFARFSLSLGCICSFAFPSSDCHISPCIIVHSSDVGVLKNPFCRYSVAILSLFFVSMKTCPLLPRRSFVFNRFFLCSFSL